MRSRVSMTDRPHHFSVPLYSPLTRPLKINQRAKSIYWMAKGKAIMPTPPMSKASKAGNKPSPEQQVVEEEAGESEKEQDPK